MPHTLKTPYTYVCRPYSSFQATESDLVVVGISAVTVDMKNADTKALIKGMRVQSLSHWAPAAIAPYSQAVGVGAQCVYAGQIGMQPETLELPRKRKTEEDTYQQCWLALRHVHRLIHVSFFSFSHFY